MWDYYGEVEQALKISGPVNYPWGPKRPRYPYRAHELNAAALVLAKGAEEVGIRWSPTPLATISAPRGLAHPCVYRGFCVVGPALSYALLQLDRAAHRLEGAGELDQDVVAGGLDHAITGLGNFWVHD